MHNAYTLTLRDGSTQTVLAADRTRAVRQFMADGGSYHDLERVELHMRIQSHRGVIVRYAEVRR